MKLLNGCLKMRILLGIMTLISSGAYGRTPAALPSHASQQSDLQNQLRQQLGESAFLLRSAQNDQILRGPKVNQLMNLCKVIGQTQVLLLQLQSRSEQMFSVDQNLKSQLQSSVSLLQQACDSSQESSIDPILKRAWELTSQVQKKLTYLSRTYPLREDL